jgi:uncharacterized protein YukJ
MSLKRYSVLVGRLINVRQGSGASPHYQLHLVDDTTDYRVAINIQSGDQSFVEFVIRDPFDHPILSSIADLPLGLHALQTGPTEGGLDYIRGNLVQPWEFVPLPPNAPGPDNDLNEKVDGFAQRALADEAALVYAFGEPWGPEPSKKDKYFGFLPGHGIHDIHMNQGNPSPGSFAKDNGVWQDGGVIFRFPGADRWIAVFLRFQTQSWHTDDKTGHPLVETGPAAPMPPNRQPTFEVPDGLVRIVGALVNDTRSPEQETVTLLNTSDVDVTLEGWQIRDSQKRPTLLSGKIARGATLVVPMMKPSELTNKGGIITLLDERGVKVHGVAYSKEQARHPGWTIPFVH